MFIHGIDAICYLFDYEEPCNESPEMFYEEGIGELNLSKVIYIELFTFVNLG